MLADTSTMNIIDLVQDQWISCYWIIELYGANGGHNFGRCEACHFAGIVDRIRAPTRRQMRYMGQRY